MTKRNENHDDTTSDQVGSILLADLWSMDLET